MASSAETKIRELGQNEAWCVGVGPRQSARKKPAEVKAFPCVNGNPAPETVLDVAPALSGFGSKCNECHVANYLLSSHHLHRPGSDMGLRDFLSLPKDPRRSRSKARSDIVPLEGQGDADLVAHQRSAESTPDLRIGSSTSTTSSPLTSRDRESNGTRTTLPRVVHLTALYSPNADRSISDRLRSVFRRDQSNRQKSSDYIVDPSAAYEKKPSWKSTAYATTKLAIHMMKESSDAFPPLKSVAGGLSAILKHCDVHPSSYHPTHDAHGCPSKR